MGKKSLSIYRASLSEEHKIFYLKSAYNIPARQIMRTIFLFCKGGQLCDFFCNLYLPPEFNSLRNMLPIATV